MHLSCNPKFFVRIPQPSTSASTSFLVSLYPISKSVVPNQTWGRVWRSHPISALSCYFFLPPDCHGCRSCGAPRRWTPRNTRTLWRGRRWRRDLSWLVLSFNVLRSHHNLQRISGWSRAYGDKKSKYWVSVRALITRLPQPLFRLHYLVFYK